MHEHTVRRDLLHLVEEAHDQFEHDRPVDLERRYVELPREWGIDPNVDLDNHVLVAVPRCPSCRGSGRAHAAWPGSGPGERDGPVEWLPTRTPAPPIRSSPCSAL